MELRIRGKYHHIDFESSKNIIEVLSVSRVAHMLQIFASKFKMTLTKVGNMNNILEILAKMLKVLYKIGCKLINVFEKLFIGLFGARNLHYSGPFWETEVEFIYNISPLPLLLVP